MNEMTALVIGNLRWNLMRRFAKEGWNVVVNGGQNDENLIRNIQKEYRGSRIIARSANLEKESDVQRLVQEVLHQFEHVEILILNHQCQRHYRASIDEFPTEKWREIIDHNLISTFALIKTLWPHMKRRYFGRIIHLANEQSFIASEYQSACIASHHALIGLNKALAIEGAPFGITSNIISPGHMQTNPFEQFDHIQTLADLVLFLCTDQARSISGQSIPWRLNTFERCIYN